MKMGNKLSKLKRNKKKQERFKRKSAKDFQNLLSLAYKYKILKGAGEYIEFTDQYRQAVANAMRSLSVDTSTPANLVSNMRRANVLAILHQAGELKKQEISQLLMIVEAMTGIHKNAEFISVAFSQLSSINEVNI